VTDSATLATPEAGDEDLGEDLGGLDDLLAYSTSKRHSNSSVYERFLVDALKTNIDREVPTYLVFNF